MDHEHLTISPAPMDAGEGIEEDYIDLEAFAENPAEVTEDDPKTQGLVRRILRNPWVQRATLAGAGIMATVRPVAAESMNWTPIQEMFEGISGLMPSVATLITAIVPVILLLMVVGFLTGLLDGIIDAIRGGLNSFKR